MAQPFLERLGQQTGETINLGIATGGVEGTSRAGSGAGAGPADAGGTARAGGGGAGSDVGGSDVGGHAVGGHAIGGHAIGGHAIGGHAIGGIAVGGIAVEQIAQVDSRYMIGGTNWLGLAVPLHCSALGKVLLAFGAASLPAEPYQARTDRTITTRVALHAELAAVRDRGYAVTDEELEPGLVAVAAPVFAGSPVAIAAISVSAPASRLTAGQVPVVAGLCAQAASALSATLAGPSGIGTAHRKTAA